MIFIDWVHFGTAPDGRSISVKYGNGLYEIVASSIIGGRCVYDLLRSGCYDYGGYAPPYYPDIAAVLMYARSLTEGRIEDSDY